MRGGLREREAEKVGKRNRKVKAGVNKP